MNGSRMTLGKTLAALALSLALVPAGLAFAQEQGQSSDRGSEADRGNRGGGRGGFGNFDPAQFRQRMVERLKEELGASDEEWQVLQPKIDKVMEARFAQFSGARGGRFGGNRDGEDQREPRNATERAVRELRQALDNKESSADTIAAKLQAVRDARKKAADDLKAAQEDLKSVLTQRQEAILVLNGTLE